MPTTLTYELPKEEFDQFLHETFGIEQNDLDVREAVRAATTCSVSGVWHVERISKLRQLLVF
jgi:hypothetical protein